MIDLKKQMSEWKRNQNIINNIIGLRKYIN